MSTKEVTAMKVLLKNSRGEYLIPYTEEKFDIDAHTENMSNPHQVTKSQVGLGNVDNTSDVNKPVSTAQKSYVDNFQPPITALTATSGTISLAVNKIYTLSVTEDIVFSLPIPSDKSVFNQIKVMMQITGTPLIDWGTKNFFNKEIPEITEGNYDCYFDFDNNMDSWVLGVMSKGKDENEDEESEGE